MDCHVVALETVIRGLGETHLRVEPLARGAGFEFVDIVKGGVIPGVFMAAVEKGVLQALTDGVVAGFPVHDIRVTVYDGKTHAVDAVAISGQIPLAELDDYQGRLKSLTGGQGSYSITFSHYAPVPGNTQEQLASKFKAVNLGDD